MTALVNATGIIDLAEAVEDAEQAQAAADRIAQRFDKIAADVAAFAAFVRSNPDLAQHMPNTTLGSTSIVNVYVLDAETLALFARAAARAGRKVKKTTFGRDEQFFGIEVRFGDWLQMDVYATRDNVCERVVTGTREVTEEVPDPEALAAVPTTKVTRVEDVVEWRCGSLLAPADAPQVGA